MAAGVAGVGAAASYCQARSREGKDGTITSSRVPLVVPERAHGRDQAAAVRAVPGEVHGCKLLGSAAHPCWAVKQ